jgi:AbiTii
MTTLVHDLQQAALDEAVAVSKLLRKALLVASKLGVSDFEAWARSELEGYDGQTPIPEYRRVVGTPMAWNPYHGNQHLQTQTAEVAKKLSEMTLHFSVDTLDQGSRKGGGWQLNYNPGMEHAIMKDMNVPMKPHLFVSDASIRAILGRIRTIVLDWSLTLEKRGVLGEGMAFSANEKQQASSVHIGTFIQNVADSQLQVNSPGAVIQQGITAAQLADLKALIEILDDKTVSTPLSGDELGELRAERDVLLAQVNSPKPKQSVVRASLNSLKGVLEGAGGELLAGSLPRAIELVAGLLHSIT